MPRLPRVTGKDVISALQKAGFSVFDQEGSHVYLHIRQGDAFGSRVTEPLHSGKILKPKTLKSILNAAGISTEDFTNLLRK